jgi:tetratricopeptide (TPR) repeat protein
MRQIILTLAVVAALAGPGAAQPPDLAARSRAAAAAMNAGRFDEAARLYREMLQALPDEPGLLMNLGMALAMGGHEQQAIPPLERAIALNPTLIPAYLFLGTSHLALGNSTEAVGPLERVVAADATDVDNRRLLAQAYAGAGRVADAVTELHRITELAPKLPAAWHALGHAYNTLTQQAMETFDAEPEDSPWRQLLVADAFFADGRFTDAFALYRAVLDALPSMVSVHDSIARIYEITGHADWAAEERRRGHLPASACAARKALCEFRAGRHREALVAARAGEDPESRYWRVRAANELALGAFARLDALPDSRERREVRASLARGERRYRDAIAELEVALSFAPRDPGLIDDLGTAYYLARDYEQAVATLAPLLKANGGDARLLTVYGDSLLHLQRVDEALRVLRRAVEMSQGDSVPRLTLGRAYVQHGDFAAAIPLIEPHLAEDHDGSLHAQLARAYTGVGQREKAVPLLERSQALQRAAREHADEVAQRTITPP